MPKLHGSYPLAETADRKIIAVPAKLWHWNIHPLSRPHLLELKNMHRLEIWAARSTRASLVGSNSLEESASRNWKFQRPPLDRVEKKLCCYDKSLNTQETAIGGAPLLFKFVWQLSCKVTPEDIMKLAGTYELEQNCRGVCNRKRNQQENGRTMACLLQHLQRALFMDKTKNT